MHVISCPGVTSGTRDAPAPHRLSRQHGVPLSSPLHLKSASFHIDPAYIMSARKRVASSFASLYDDEPENTTTPHLNAPKPSKDPLQEEDDQESNLEDNYPSEAEADFGRVVWKRRAECVSLGFCVYHLLLG
jgi:hypothetical protein